MSHHQTRFFRAAAAAALAVLAGGAVADQQPPLPSGPAAPAPSGSPSSSPAQTAPSAPLDTSGLQSQALLSAIDKILKRAAAEREAAKTLPVRDQFLFPPIWTETREEREGAVRELLDSALAIVTDAPILSLQENIRKQREAIDKNNERIAALREKRLEAPPSSVMPSILVETQGSIDSAIATLQNDTKRRETEILEIKKKIAQSLRAAGVALSPEQLDLLLDSVLGGDLLKLVTAFEVARIADQRLGTLVKESSEDVKAARRYFAMHAALFAMLVHAQELLIERIDTVYLARLTQIQVNISKARVQTQDLLRSQNREDQKKILEANLKSQEISQNVSSFYKSYLVAQRAKLAEARNKTLFDLRIADNTYETVEASFQLKALMDEARTSFEALQKLETPGFEQIFRNDELKKEFENLTQKLGPTS